MGPPKPDCSAILMVWFDPFCDVAYASLYIYLCWTETRARAILRPPRGVISWPDDGRPPAQCIIAVNKLSVVYLVSSTFNHQIQFKHIIYIYIYIHIYIYICIILMQNGLGATLSLFTACAGQPCRGPA